MPTRQMRKWRRAVRAMMPQGEPRGCQRWTLQTQRGWLVLGFGLTSSLLSEVSGQLWSGCASGCCTYVRRSVVTCQRLCLRRWHVSSPKKLRCKDWHDWHALWTKKPCKSMTSWRERSKWNCAFGGPVPHGGYGSAGGIHSWWWHHLRSQ